MELAEAQKIDFLAHALMNVMAGCGCATREHQKVLEATCTRIAEAIDGMLTEEVRCEVNSKELLSDLLTRKSTGNDPYSGRDPAHVGKQYDAKTDTYR